MSIRIQDLLTEAMAGEQAEQHADSLTKLGILRGGNSGIILDDAAGTPAGSCPRRAHLRSLGIEIETADDSTLTMWEGGIANEAYWHDKMSRVWGGTILRESEIPISWTTSEGELVTGRPDMVLMREEEIPATQEDVDTQNYGGLAHLAVGDMIKASVPVLGLEFKSLASIWTLEKVSLGKLPMPKLEHLCQAGHYSWMLGEKFKLGRPLDYRIIYSAHVNFSGPEWIAKMLPQAYEMTGIVGNHPVIEMGKDGKFKNTRPHHTIYELSWAGDQLRYRREGAESTYTGRGANKVDTSWTLTPVTWSGIQRYYAAAGKKMRERLPPRPVSLKSDYSIANFSLCDARYCPLSETCDKHEKQGYNQWLQAVRRLSK